uniref:Ig-like domain-containing protein n=1 Tax=uncultured Pontibacter sp. TaxID=453356 RepID=UPI00260A929F
FLGVDVFRNIVVENCYMENTAGIYIGQRYEGNGSGANSIKIRYNKAKNIDGRVHGGQTFAQFVQFNYRGTVPGVEVAWNQVINDAGNSAVEDNINIYNTKGAAGNPIRIHNNYIEGAYPIPHTGSSYSGGGIITDGDGDISIAPAYIEANDNHLVNLGNYSMGIAGGNNVRYHHNRAINSATFKNGAKFAMYTSGLWSKDYYKKNTTFNNSVDNNTVAINAWGYTNNRNDVSVAEDAAFTNNNFLPGAVSLQMEAEEFSRWNQKLAQQGIKLGPNGSAGNATTPAPAPAPTPTPAPTPAPAENKAPSITITAPTAGAKFTAGNAIALTANASDADGTVAKVEFFSGSTKLGEAVKAPFTYNWTNAAAGSYSLTAKATDNKGATKTSAVVTITVSAAATATTPPANPGGSTGTTTPPSSGTGGSNAADLAYTTEAAYPNPFKDVLVLDLSAKKVKLQSVVLKNQTGQVVYEEKGSLNLVNDKLELNLSNTTIKSGLYYVTYTDTQGKSQAIKVVKE